MLLLQQLWQARLLTRNLARLASLVVQAKTFTLVGDRFRFFLDGFENPVLRVKEGNTVRIVLASNDMPHDWVVDELNARTARVVKGEPAVSVEFVASKKGTFEYYCSVGQHRANGMKGTLVVE